MKKNQPRTATPTAKLSLKAETLRQMSESLDDQHLAAVMGGLRSGSNHCASSSCTNPNGC